MINLLPPEVKSGYRYALRNVSLRRWALLFVVALIGLGGIATYGLLTLQQSSVQYENQIANIQAFLNKQKFKETQGQVKDISGSFKLVVQVLSQEVLFSQLLKQIGATIPNNANLTGLSIAQTKGAIDLSAVTTDYKTATQVQVNLADPDNKIFSKADIININCNGTNLLDPRYPCVVNIRALFADNNPYLFINSKSTKVKS
jgi:Tfp pilus assembly protein PilN